jgi:hypothetical protein
VLPLHHSPVLCVAVETQAPSIGLQAPVPAATRGFWPGVTSLKGITIAIATEGPNLAFVLTERVQLPAPAHAYSVRR